MSKAGTIDNSIAAARWLNCDSIVFSPYQPRLNPEKANIEEITGAIRLDGVKKPILVRPLYQKPGDKKSKVVGYELVDGERRLRGSRATGREQIPAIVEDMDDVTARRLAIVLNIQSEFLTEYEIAQGLKQQLHPADGSEPLSINELCRQINKSRTYVDNHVKLARVRQELTHLAQVDDKMSIVLLLDGLKNEVLFGELLEIANDGAPYRIIEILSTVADPEARAEIHSLWKRGAKLKKLEEMRDKAVEAADAKAQLLIESTTPPDQETSSRASINARTGGGNVSRGRNVTGLSLSEGNQGLHQTVKELWWKMENCEKWAGSASKAKRKKEAAFLEQIAEQLLAISQQWQTEDKVSKISTPYPEDE